MAVDVSMWSSEAWSSAADMYLLARTREGSDEAFAELWRRHLPAAYGVADRYRSRVPAEDVVAEAATRVLALIKDGRGPDENFRAYFLSAVRSVAVDAGRRDLRLVPTDDADLDGLIEPFVLDVEADGYDLEVVRAAFRMLPERDQRILWHTTVEGEAPRVVGPALGMSANAVSVRAMRAREALRARYLEAYAAQHLAGATTPECEWAIGVLGDHVRGRLPKRANDRLQEHLAGCAHESGLLAELHTIQERFPALIVPLLLVAGASTPGFLGGPALAALGGAAGAVAPAEPVGGAEHVVGAEPVGDGAVVGSVVDDEGAGSIASELGLDAAPEPAHAAPDAPSSVPSRAAGLTAALIVALGLLTGTPAQVPDVATGSALPPASSSSSSSSGQGSSTTSGTTSQISTTTTPTTTATTTTTLATTTSTTAARSATPTGVPAPAPPGTTAAPPSSTRPGPTIELRVISSGTPTKFSLRFSTETTGTLRVSVANASGAGVLSAENGAFTCSNTSRSSVGCTGRTGHILLEQSGLPSPGSVVVSVTDSAGGTTTQTLRLR